jgi:predicted aspartyl protease
MMSRNGIGIRTRTLLDTGANGFVFIDSKLAIELSKHLDAPIRRLETSYHVRGFNGQRADDITEYIELNLHLDRRTQAKTPMLIANLGNRAMIIGRTWFELYNVLVDCKRQGLVWPENLPPNRTWNKIITVQAQDLFRNHEPHYQEDALCRDSLIDYEIRRDAKKKAMTADWRTKGTTWVATQEAQYKIMKRELEGGTPEVEVEVQSQAAKPYKRGKSSSKPKVIDIRGLSGVSFYMNLKRPENTFFKTSLYEIDRLIEERRE